MFARLFRPEPGAIAFVLVFTVHLRGGFPARVTAADTNKTKSHVPIFADLR